MGELNYIHKGMEVTGLYVVLCDTVSYLRDYDYSIGHCLTVVEFYGKVGRKQAKKKKGFTTRFSI